MHTPMSTAREEYQRQLHDAPEQQGPNPDGQDAGTRPPHNSMQVCSNDSERTAREPSSFVENEKPPLSEVDTLSQRTAARTRSKREEHRLGDDLELLRAERESIKDEKPSVYGGRPRPKRPSIDRRETEKTLSPPGGNQKWTPPSQPQNKLGAFVKNVHQSSLLVRYFTYIVPVALILLIPLLLARYLFRDRTVGGVRLMWFCIWLMIVWLSLWAGRLISDCIPPVVSVLASIFTNNSKKWKNVAVRLKLPLTLFFWWMAVFISFQPTMRYHHADGNTDLRYWEERTHIVLLTIFVGTSLNLVEKIIIQLISMTFHTRTYEDRITINKFQISCLVKLYAYSRNVLRNYNMERPQSTSGTRTPRDVLFQAVAGGARNVVRTVGDAVGKIAGDFVGKEVQNSASPKVVVRTLLAERDGTLALARRLYRTFADQEADVLHPDDLKKVFTDEEEADACFSMFDRDMNGDITCEEMELACGEVAQERKAITAGLQDLDIVISQLDNLFSAVVLILTILLFVSLISESSLNVLTGASALVLAFSFAFSSTAQEIVNAILFVFVKHPFDVGDRVDIYPTGNVSVGQTYYVKNLSLLYTEFKRPEGHIVQMPNQFLNTVVILNMRRTAAGLAEAIPVYLKFGTTLEQIEGLREKMLAFVKAEKREYDGKILTELKDIISPTWELKLNVVFFYKSNWQNELVRLARRNKIICSLMTALDELGIESSHTRWAGHSPSAPLYLQGSSGMLSNVIPDQQYDPSQSGPGGPPTNMRAPVDGAHMEQDNRSTYSTGVHRTQSIHSAHGLTRTRSGTRPIDLSLGASDMVAYDDSSDVFSDRRRPRRPSHLLARVKEEEEAQRKLERQQSKASSAHSHTLHLPLGREETHGSKTSGSFMRSKLFGRGKDKERTSEDGSHPYEGESFRPGDGYIGPGKNPGSMV